MYGVILLFITIVVTILLIHKFWCFWSRSKICLVDKTAIITGGASGLGYQTALALAAKGCRVIIADVADTSQAVEGIVKETHNPNIIGKNVDLQSFKSVRKFAKEVLADEEKLNILICNAGIGEVGNKITDDGLQRTMQINYFSHFLLIHLLLDLLKKSASSRIIFTSSLVAYISDLTINTLNPKPEYFQGMKTKITMGSYSNSKLAMVAAAKVFGKKLKGNGITANVVHPGAVKTAFYLSALRNVFHGMTAFFGIFAFLFGKNSEAGAQTLIHLAQSDEVKNITGQSFIKGMRVPQPFQLDDDLCQKIWNKSIEYTRLESQEVKCLGYQTVLALAAKGCRVIIADVVNISQAVEQIIKETHNPNIIGKKIDLQSFKSVREFAKDVLATEEKLNILICNAGIGEFGNKKTEDGLQKTMQINYFSHFLLIHLLLDLLKKSAPSRIIFTSSLMAYISDLTINTLNPKQEYFCRFKTKITLGCYSNSKLAMAVAAKMLGSKLEGTGVTANSVHVGAVRTPIYLSALKNEVQPIVVILGAFVLLFGKNSEEGAQTLIHLAQSDEVENITGQSFVEGMRFPRPFQLNDNFCQKIWNKSIEYTRLESYEIKC